MQRIKVYIKSIFFVFAMLLLCTVSSCDLFKPSTKKTALLYGVSTYQPLRPPPGPNVSTTNLTWPVNDVDGMEAMLEGFGWTVTARRDALASKTQLADDIANLAATVESGERIIFYWSGHGAELSEGAGPLDSWIAPYGTYDPGSMSSSLNFDAMISTSELAELFKPLQEKNANLIFILDSCNSGGFIQNDSYFSPLPDNYSEHPELGDPLNDKKLLFDGLSLHFANTQNPSSQTPNVWVLASSGRSEESWESPEYEHGVVTYAILKATELRDGRFNADPNFDGRITLHELYAYSKAFLSHWNKLFADRIDKDLQYFPHLSGNSLDIVLFSQP